MLHYIVLESGVADNIHRGPLSLFMFALLFLDCIMVSLYSDSECESKVVVVLVVTARAFLTFTYPH
jgi:hypothetical protein